jgi:hypothetical protein
MDKTIAAIGGNILPVIDRDVYGQRGSDNPKKPIPTLRESASKNYWHPF